MVGTTKPFARIRLRDRGPGKFTLESKGRTLIIALMWPGIRPRFLSFAAPPPSEHSTFVQSAEPSSREDSQPERWPAGTSTDTIAQVFLLALRRISGEVTYEA